MLIIGFGIGIGTNIFIGNLITAIEGDLIDRTINSQPHITITPTNTSAYFDEYKSILEELEKIPEVKLTCKILEGRAFIVNINEDAPQDITVRGFNDLENGNEIYNYYNDKFIGHAPEEPNQVLIGKQMAEELNISLGARLNVSISPMAPIGRILYVSGIFDLGSAMMNEIWLIGSIVMAGFVFYDLDQVSSLLVQVNDHMEADRIADQLEGRLGREDIIITHWKKENDALLNSLQAQSISTKIVQFFILLSVAIAIASVLSITVVHKQKQIGILKAIGLSDHRSGQIFLAQGGLLGLAGTIFGTIFGMVIILLFNIFGGDDVVIIRIQPGFTLISVTIAMVAALFASYVPSKSSRELEIIEIIQRH